jgi:hypothetical protein
MRMLSRGPCLASIPRCVTALHAGTEPHTALKGLSAGVRSPRARCGRRWLSSRRQGSITTRASSTLRKPSALRPSSRHLPMKRSADPFAQGGPGVMDTVRVAPAPSQACHGGAMNSGPLSLRRDAAAPRGSHNGASVSRTSSAPSRFSTRMATRSRGYSSSPMRLVNSCPDAVRSQRQSSVQL